jgi:ATP-dependent RNA helicase DeaD
MSDKTEQPPLPEAFAALGIRNSVLKGLAACQYVTPSEIQALLIPPALEGGDLLGQARTGTGKTAAFGIPILCKVTPKVPVQALIMVPTRELAIQVEAEITRLAQFTPVRTVSVVGGQRIVSQVKRLEHDPEIIVGTPGRVIDLLDRRLMFLDNIRFVVLDEVDRMLDIGFRDDIRNILSRLKGMRRSQPVGDSQGGQEGESREIERGDASHQTIFVSATISDEIERLARRYMLEPVKKLIAPGADDKPTVDKIKQGYITVDVWDKYRLLKFLLQREKPELAIVFCRTKHGADKVAHSLRADGIECMEIHGDLRQSKRDKVMKGFRGGKYEVLVATDLASRGIDVAGVTHIFNYDLPDDPEVYVHRIGRTARMGAEGKAFTFVLRDQGEMLTKVENLINMLIPVEAVEGFVFRPPPREQGGRGPSGPAATGAGSSAPSTDSPAAPPTPAVPAAPPKRVSLGSKIKRTRRR